MSIELYSTGCPRCKVLKKKLEFKKLEYVLKNSKEDLEELQNLGFTSAPILKIDDNYYKFEDANKIINSL